VKVICLVSVVPVVEPGTLTGAPPPWGVKVTVSAGAVTPISKPVAVTVTPAPATPLGGKILSSVSVRVPVMTVNAFACVMISTPATVTDLEPNAALEFMTNVAIAVPLDCTAMGPFAPSGAPPTEMPAPKLAVVPPTGNVVLAPVIVT
jgi:hypothetical protein